MSKPQFVFTQRKNSFSVHIPNLEDLSVADIQIIETFVENRKGIFDFNTYTFVIPKKLEFHEFIALLKHINMNAECSQQEMGNSSSSNVVSFGQYKGMLYSDLPDAYLLWLKDNYRGRESAFVRQELTNRNL
ncbi:putative quorum-sensing-regulated virulence factor [Sulfurimonas paralvinellae]|uniref:DUF3820 family protein n=1 Tax=Sulfurimonas paralvinellae TaxID=317658 RepID=A0A7M1B8E6_9BACT|nr:DUF3820 family protein [Sulfurimonas paralvinellae]QOP45716.1 DUF3820 family protein [Sulfurimonas paralvinellae]